MTARLLETVPNFSEGRDVGIIDEIVGAMRAAGADVLDCTADADHHRCVVTAVGDPASIEEAAVAGARVARDRIDLRTHRGVHPRIGALDVLPFVPLLGLSMTDARLSAHRVGTRITSELGVPVFFYAEASEPPGRQLSELRRGGFEALVGSWPAGREPDLLPAGWEHGGAHPTAGASCVGARDVLLAWNVVVRELSLETARDIAREVRESGGGLPGVRALALALPSRGDIQISMNVERLDSTGPLELFRRLEQAVAAAGGCVVDTEVIGLVPDQLVLSAAADRLHLSQRDLGRLLSRRLVEHLGGAAIGPLPESNAESRTG